MGLLDNIGQAPDIGMPQMPPMLAQAQPQTPQAQQAQPTYPGLKKAPPPVGMTVSGYTYMGGDPRSKDPSVWKPASGDDFLNSLPLDDTKKTIIKGISNYELPPGSQRGGLGSPEVQQLLGLAKQYNPQFDAKNYSAVQKTRTEIANPDSQFNKTKTALNTSITHAYDLLQDSDKLKNTNNPTWNMMGNFVDENVLGDPRQGNFRQNAQFLSGETIKAITGATGGGEQDRRQQEANYPLNGSPVQQQQAVSKTMQLLKAKMDEMQATLKQAGNPNANALDMLSPTAKQAWTGLQQRFSGGQQPAATPSGVDPALWKHMTPQERALWN